MSCEKDKMGLWKVYIVRLDEDGDAFDLIGEQTVLAKSKSDAVLLADRAEGKALELDITKFVAVHIEDV